MSFVRLSLLRFVSFAAAFWALTSPASAATQLLQGHVPQAVASSRSLGPLPRSEQIQLAIGLPLRNQAELENLLKQLADPSSPQFRQYLTPGQFAERFGPSEDDYNALAQFFEAQGFVITGTHPNRTILDVRATAAKIERTFHLNMLRWNHPSRGVFFAPDREPVLDAGVTILDITGLDNFVLPHPMDLKAHGLLPLTTGSGPNGLFNGSDYRAAYAPSVTLNGAGQSIGLFELDGFYSADVQANFRQAGLTPVPTQTVLLDGFNGAPGSANIEVILDIMMAAYMAPGATSIIVYEGTNWNDVLNRMATDNLASQLSSSWCFSPTNATTEQIFKQMIAQGQSLFQASGDDGSYQGYIMPPADDPNVTVVGGTSLTTTTAGGAWKSEAAWAGSGGGVSVIWPLPSYQTPAVMSAAHGSTSMRNIPDVALLADIQIFLICNNGQRISVGGTSAAAPLWAGFLALANQQAASNKKPRVGFLNPVIYALGAGSSYSSSLHDVVNGNNGGYNALPGYDLVTGWGSPAGQALINALTASSSTPSFSLASSASTLSIAAGSNAASTITVSPQQGFSGTVNLSASGLPAGVTASFSPAAATTTSTLTLTASSSAATTTATITITGTSGSLTNTAKLSLTITAPQAFSLSPSPSSVTLTPGATAASTFTVTPQSGFNGAVAFSASGLPSGVTASFNPASSTRSNSITFTAAASAPAATATVTVTGTSGVATNRAAIALTVTGPPSFTLSATPASLSFAPGSSAQSNITINAQNGFNSAVALTASALPAGITATFGSASGTAPRSVTFIATKTAAAGNVSVTITGTSGALTARTTIALTIAPPPGFTLTASPTSLTVAQGATGTTTLTLTAQNGFTGSVTVSIVGLPNGVSGMFGSGPTPSSCIFGLSIAPTAAPGPYTVNLKATSGSLTQTLAISLSITQASAPAGSVNLSASYNVMGSVSDGANFLNGSGLDGGGRAYSGALLSRVVTASGAPYTFGPANAPGAMSSATVALPSGKFSRLTLLATGVNGNQVAQKFTVTYTDGSTAAFTQSLSDWCVPQGYAGEINAVPMSYRNLSNGTRDVRLVLLYAYNFTLSNTKTVKSITLPGNRNVVVLAMNLSTASIVAANPGSSIVLTPGLARRRR